MYRTMFHRALIAVALLFLAVGARADTTGEINTLLDFVANSGCQFTRNGTTYGPAEARDHIAMKYDYVRSHVKSAEDFIEYAATRSSMSGRAYTVECAGKVTPSGEWLRAELARIRDNDGQKAAQVR